MIVKAWFNERGYYIETEKGESRFIYDLPVEVINNAIALYTSRWMVFNHVSETIQNLGQTLSGVDLVLYTDSRLVEELKGELTPNNAYARASLHYFIQCDYAGFRRVTIEKCAPTTVSNKLNAAQGDTTRSG